MELEVLGVILTGLGQEMTIQFLQQVKFLLLVDMTIEAVHGDSDYTFPETGIYQV